MTAPAAAPRRTTRRFKVERRFDGAAGMVIEIILTGPEPLFRVRLKHRRATIEIPLGDVAEMILIRDARIRAADAAKERKAKRALRARPRR